MFQEKCKACVIRLSQPCRLGSYECKAKGVWETGDGASGDDSRLVQWHSGP